MNQPSRQVEVQLGHLCNNRCVFCVSGQLSEQKRAPQLAEAPIRRQLKEARDAGATKITLLGGEPTLQRSFLPLLQFAVDLDFDEIVIFTNGVMTPRDSFRARVQKILAGLGDRARERVVWRFSLQGGDRDHHDATTENPGAWDRITQSMTALKASGARLTGNICVVEQNYRSVSALAEIAERFEFEDLHLDMVRPRDSGDRTDEQLRAMMARYSDMAPEFRELLTQCDTRLGPDFDVNIGNLPYCIAPDLAHKMHHDGEFTVTVAASGQGTTQEGFDKYKDKRSDKHKLPTCGDCVFGDRCGGIFDKYAEFHGHEEFLPVTAEQLRAVDSRGAHFVLLAEAAIRRWAASLTPTAGRLVIGRLDERAGSIDAGFHAAAGGKWQFILRDPRNAGRRGGWMRLAGDEVAIELVGTPALGAIDSLRGVIQGLSSSLGSGQPPVVDANAIRHAWRQAKSDAVAAGQKRKRSQQRVAAVAERLRGKDLAGLQYVGMARGEGDGGLSLEWRGDAGLIRLHIATEEGSARPNFDHESTGVSAATLAEFNSALGAALRQRR
ncbi:MAG: radical SAM protein [Myxococcales bacterium]|nr:radical SAM protein [Myxococcales bacterium]